MFEIVPNWHPVFVHFPIALLSVAIVALLLAVLSPQSVTARGEWWRFGHWNLRLGYIAALVAAWFGWLAYHSVPHDAISHEVMTHHRNKAFLTIALLTPFFIMSWFASHWRGMRALVFSLAMLIPGISLAYTGLLGGELVYQHGVGVERLPDPDSHGHDHGDRGQHPHEHSDHQGHTHRGNSSPHFEEPVSDSSPADEASQQYVENQEVQEDASPDTTDNHEHVH